MSEQQTRTDNGRRAIIVGWCVRSDHDNDGVVAELPARGLGGVRANRRWHRDTEDDVANAIA